MMQGFADLEIMMNEADELCQHIGLHFQAEAAYLRSKIFRYSATSRMDRSRQAPTHLRLHGFAGVL